MLYVCIPVHNEATTIGVLLWRIRTVLQEYTREYEVVVYDDGSSDETAEVLEPYRRVLPLTVLRAPRRRGTAAAVDALCRHVVSHTRYPRRDAVVLMQGDFTDRPEDLPELAKRFEGGADLVIGRRPASLEQPPAERRLRQMAPWVLRPFVRVAEVDDLVTGFRLVRVSVLRDLARARGDALLAEGEGWSATVDFALAVAPYARRVDVMELPGRYDLRPRASRLDVWRELRELAGYAWRARGRRVSAGDRLGEKGPERPVERGPERAPDREVAVIGSVSALTLAESERGPRATRAEEERGGRAARDKRRGERPERADRPERPERPERPKRTAAAPEGEARKRAKPRREDAPRAAAPAEAVGESGGQPEAAPRPRRERAPRPERPPRDAAPVAPEVVGDAPATEPAEETVSPGVAAAVEAAEDAADEAMGAGPRKRTRRRRRRSRGAGGDAGAESGGESGSEPGAEPGADAGDDSGEARGRSVDDGDAGGGEEAEADGGAGESGEGVARKRSRRRRRGRGRGERAAGGGAEGGTEPSGGVAEASTGAGAVVPRAPEPDRAAD